MSDPEPPQSKMDIDRPKKSKKRTAPKEDEASSSEEEEKDLLNIDFEFFDPLPHDFHGIKLLLRQLFDADASLLDLSALTDIILDQKLVGSTVKVDGREGDPFSFLSLLNLELHSNSPAVKSLLEYITSQTTSTPLHPLLPPLIGENSKTAIILSERLINMPPEISPPSYKMLLEEISYAVEDGEPYNFTHYLLLSKLYSEVESTIPTSPPPSTKRQKTKSKKKSKEELTFNFHPEDDIFLQNAVEAITYNYKHSPPPEAADSKRAFQDAGIVTKGRMVLMTKDGFERAISLL
ncbi:hypothetical protein TWF481_012099 [Arthrobotrys musiformis]|uniref:Protein BCP1 n=1 Tax=Arthrobotrys musiformis TaxID=47236 RepID=A0AAV9VYI6_9PEZI